MKLALRSSRLITGTLIALFLLSLSIYGAVVALVSGNPDMVQLFGTPAMMFVGVFYFFLVPLAISVLVTFYAAQLKIQQTQQDGKLLPQALFAIMLLAAVITGWSNYLIYAQAGFVSSVFQMLIPAELAVIGTLAGSCIGALWVDFKMFRQQHPTAHPLRKQKA